MLLSLILAGCLCFPQATEACGSRPVVLATEALVLSEAQPARRVQLPANARSGSLPFLEVPILEISNPEKMGFSIQVYLERTRSTASEGDTERVLLGTFTPYPPDQAGSFLLRASKGFDKLKETRANTAEDRVNLLLEVKRLHPNKPWTPLVVKIAPIRWRAEL